MRLYVNKINRIIEEKIKPNIKKIYDMKIQGLQDKYIARALGISPREFQSALEESELLQDTYNDAMEILSSQLMNVVVGRALGTDGKVDKNGELIGPDHNLAFRLLEKFDSRFKQKDNNIGGGVITIEHIIRKVAENNQDIKVIDDGDSDEQTQ